MAPRDADATAPLSTYDWIGLDTTLAHTPHARWLRERVPDARCRLRFNLIEGTCQAARAGLGAAVMPAFVGDADDQLERMTQPETHGEFGVWILAHPDLRRSARVRAFTSTMTTLIAAQEGRLLGRRASRAK